jgi:Raf kinase inhibitor-like YbhB/YbcL family protein
MLAAVASAFALTSSAFHSGATIPVRYTCDGANVSPPLHWTAPPRGTRYLSLTVLDPDAPVAGGFVHWRIARLAAATRGLPTGSKLGGPNSTGGNGWTGPCPPAGAAHHYRFTLRAVGAGGKVLATARLVGLYKR